MYIEGEVPTISAGSNSGYGNGLFGGDGWWAIIIFALIFGWGRNGNGAFGGGGNGGVMDGYVLTSDFAAVERKLDTIQAGICDSTFALNNTIVNGFNNTNQNLITQGYETRNAVNNVSNQLASCCCELQKELLENRYIDAKNTCDIINSQNANTQKIIDMYTNDKLDTLNRKLATAENQLSNNAQSRYIVDSVLDRLSPCPRPSYLVPNPNCCYNTCGCGNGFAGSVL